MSQIVAASLDRITTSSSNLAGGVATQQNAALTVQNSLTIGKTVPGGPTNTASSFISAAQTVTVGNDFTCNAAFTHNSSTVVMTASFDNTGSIASDIAAPAALIFNILQVNAPGRVITAARSFTTNAAFTVLTGTLNTLGAAAPITLTAALGMSVGDGVGGTASPSSTCCREIRWRLGHPDLPGERHGRTLHRSPGRTGPDLTHSTGTFLATINSQANIFG